MSSSHLLCTIIYCCSIVSLLGATPVLATTPIESTNPEAAASSSPLSAPQHQDSQINFQPPRISAVSRSDACQDGSTHSGLASGLREKTESVDSFGSLETYPRSHPDAKLSS